MGKVVPWCGQPSDRGRLKNRTEQLCSGRQRKLIRSLSTTVDAARTACMLVNVTVGCPSVCSSVPSIDSISDVRLVCCGARAHAADIDRQPPVLRIDRWLQAPERRLRVASC